MKYKFKKGDRVEVLMKKELPCCTWRCGEIVSGNGHNYDITFSDSLGSVRGGYTGMPPVERVPRKLMRPFPPRLDGGGTSRGWAPGDTAEMFDNMSWKAVSVSDDMGGDYYLVRLLGSVHEVRVHKSSLRVQQIWIRDQWVILGNQKSRGGGNVTGLSGKRKLRQEDEDEDLSDAESVCSNSITVTRKTPCISIYDSDRRYLTDDAESRFGWEHDIRSPLSLKEAVAVGFMC